MATCAHPTTTLGRIIKTNGDALVARRCDHCGTYVAGRWLPHPNNLNQLPVFEDRSLTVPPCVVCGARGTEEHHWAPRELFGAEADLWPKSWLCRRCHGIWHTRIAREHLKPPAARRPVPPPAPQQTRRSGGDAA